MEELNNNLLSFVNSATSNIKEALDKAPKRRRNVTVKKFVEKRVKRLENSRKPRTTGTQSSTKSKFAQLKHPTSARPQGQAIASQLQHSYTWPEITVCALPVQTAGMSTCAYPTTTSSLTSLFSNSDPNVCLSSSSPQSIDPELESLLSEFECPSVPLSRRGSHESVCTGASPPFNTLEAQMCVAEQAFSPYSDYSDELDSAYCSPVESARVSYNCSPTNLGTTLPDWSSADLLPPVTSSCLQEVGMMSSRCNWVSHDTSPLTVISTASSVPSIYDQGPPMTPTVSQLLEQYNPYPY